MKSITPISSDDVRQVIQGVCCDTPDLDLRPLDGSKVPNELFGFVLQQTETQVTFYLAYSTWDGRVLFVDEQGSVDCDDTHLIRLVRRTLCRVAVALCCARVVWTHLKPERIDGVQTMHGWLTLYWHREALRAYGGESNRRQDPEASHTPLDQIPSVIQDCILSLALPTSCRLRLATTDDLDDIARLVQGLAIFEKKPDAVNVSRDQYWIDGFQCNPPLFYCLLVDHVERGDAGDNCSSYTCGMAFCYIGYRSSTGRCWYLEDLFLESDYRGRGYGSCVMQVLGRIASRLHCDHMVWQALDWNTPALTFYNVKLGAHVQPGLMTSRFAGNRVVEEAALL